MACWLPMRFQQAWKYLLAAGKANFLGKVCLGTVKSCDEAAAYNLPKNPLSV